MKNKLRPQITVNLPLFDENPTAQIGQTLTPQRQKQLHELLRDFIVSHYQISNSDKKEQTK